MQMTLSGARLVSCPKPPQCFICDGIKPIVVDAFTVLITSPKRERYKDFAKSGSRRLCFPVFSQPEIADMLCTCFTHLDKEGVWDRYAKWGGIPR